MFPKIMVPPNHPILIGFSIINHPFFGYPYFWKHPNVKKSSTLEKTFFQHEDFQWRLVAMSCAGSEN